MKNDDVDRLIEEFRPQYTTSSDRDIALYELLGELWDRVRSLEEENHSREIEEEYQREFE